MDVHGRTATMALKAQLVQLIEGQMPGIGDAAGAQCVVQRAPCGWTAPGTRLPSGLCYSACRLADAKQKLDGGQQLRIAIVQFLMQGRHSTCPNDHAGHSLLALFVAPIMLRQVMLGENASRPIGHFALSPALFCQVTPSTWSTRHMIERCLLTRNSWHFCRSEVSDEGADSMPVPNGSRRLHTAQQRLQPRVALWSQEFRPRTQTSRVLA